MPGHKPIQFLDAKPRDQAIRIWHQALALEPLPAEEVALADALGRVLAEDVRAPLDVPPFDRAIVDGFALVASDTFGAAEADPVRLRRLPGRVLAGDDPEVEVAKGSAIEIATGAVLPRGASGVQMVERTDLDGDDGVLVYKAVVPGENVQAAGSDLRQGEVIVTRGSELGSRETGLLAALGIARLNCHRRPLVAVLSTGDELVSPGTPLRPGQIYDSNSRVIADALRENGAEPRFLGIVPDDEARLRRALEEAMAYDAVALSGGTSKGTGDLSFRLIDELGSPGILVHGVQLKPGKPVVLAAWGGKPVVVLPGFPTSAVLTFNLFLRPVVRRLGGLPAEAESFSVEAEVAGKVHSAAGRYEYLMVNLVRRGDGRLVAHPVAKSSGSVSAFAEADGYLEVPESRDLLLAGERAKVTLLGRGVRAADLVSIGSHCVGMDRLLARLRLRHGIVVKVVHAGSQTGVKAIARGEADLAGIHLPGAPGSRNREAVAAAGGQAALVRGYRRRLGLLFRRDRFPDAAPDLARLVDDRGARLVNRPRGSGARALLDDLLAGLARQRGADPAALARAIPGFEVEARSHAGVALAVAGGRADWGLGLEAAALAHGLGFAALREEEYDLLVRRDRLGSRAVELLLEELRSPGFAAELAALGGFAVPDDIGRVLADDPAAGEPSREQAPDA